MRELPNFTKYEGYFHDGDLNDIQIQGQDLNFFIESAQLDQEDFEKGYSLNEDDRIQGVLHLKNVSKIVINDEPFEEPLQVISEMGDIFDITLENNRVRLVVEWFKFTDKSFSRFMVYEIYCDQAIFYLDESKERSEYRQVESWR